MRITCLSLLLLSLSALSCNKQDDEPWPRKITPALLSVPDCGDTTGDGIFETWNATEDSLMFSGRTHYTMPSSLAVPGYLLRMNLLSRRISQTDPSITISAVYDTGVDWITQFSLVNNITGLIEAEGTSSRPGNPSGDSLTEKVKLTNYQTLTPGCRRLYYWGGRITAPGTSMSGNQAVPDSISVFFKGHFDVEVY